MDCSFHQLSRFFKEKTDEVYISLSSGLHPFYILQLESLTNRSPEPFFHTKTRLFVCLHQFFVQSVFLTACRPAAAVLLRQNGTSGRNDIALRRFAFWPLGASVCPEPMRMPRRRDYRRAPAIARDRFFFRGVDRSCVHTSV